MKAGCGLPAQFPADLLRVDGVAQVVPGPVGYKGDEGFRLTQLPQNGFHHIQIAALIVAADVVDLRCLAPADNAVHCGTVIFHIQPVPDVFPLAVYRQRLVGHGPGDHQRDQFFRELIGAVVVGTAGNGGGQLERSHVCPHQQIGCGLGSGIGA